MKLKGLLLATNIFILIAVLPACGNNVDSSNSGSGSNPESRTAVSEIKIPKTIQKKLGTNVSVDAVVEAPAILPIEAGVIPAKIMKLKNQEKVMTLFSPNQTMSKVHEENFKYRDGQTGVQENFQSKNGGFLNWDGKSLSCGKTLIFDIQEAFTPNPSAQKLYSAKDLPFMTQKEAEKKARNFLSSLGVTVGNNVQVYALDYLILKQEQIKHQKETASNGLPAKKQRPVREWTQADDCYVFKFQLELNGIPVSGQRQFGDPRAQTLTNGPMLLVYYGEQGFVNAEVENVYEASGTAKEEKTLVGLDQALNVLNNKFDEIIMDNPITVTDIEFSYVPKLKAANQENYLLTPAWIFQLSQYSKDIKRNVKTRIIINALTGGEME